MPIIQFTKRKQKPSGKYWTAGDRVRVTVEKAAELCKSGDAKLVNVIKASNKKTEPEPGSDKDTKTKTKNK